MVKPLRVIRSTRETWCRHRTPLTDEFKTCKVGVDFHVFKFQMMPCLGESEEAKALCPQYAGWTDEELAAREAANRASFERIGTIRKAIVASIEATGDRGGRIPCPCCKTGTVAFSQASNGHVHAACSTAGCARWME